MSVNKFKPLHINTESETAPSTPIQTNRSTRSYSITNIPKNIEGNTVLYNGEVVKKTDKIISAMGSLEELSAYIGVIKTEHLNTNNDQKFDIDSSAKLFLYARLTKIQEALIDICASLGTSRKITARYEFTRFSCGQQRIGDLRHELDLMTDVDFGSLKNSMKERPLQIISGTTILESRLLYARALCRRAERQVSGAKNLQVGVSGEDVCLTYLNVLGDYLLGLSVHVLHMQSKEPMKKLFKTNQKNILNLK
jgi:cob(I)alamin adenosyltransferase